METLEVVPYEAMLSGSHRAMLDIDGDSLTPVYNLRRAA